MKRVLGKSGIEVSALGLGCWAIGGPFCLDGKIDGWGEVDDTESIKAIKRAVDLGVTFFDTADCYGTGHSERILGKALQDIRDKVVIATKFGNVFDEQSKNITHEDVSSEYIRKACEASLQRLNTDYIDVYQLHCWGLDYEKVPPVLETLDDLVGQGLIRTYGWSTDLVDGINIFAENENCSVTQNKLNVLEDSKEILEICEKQNLASINRSCLMMGILSGKFDEKSKLPADDVRSVNHDWIQYFKDGKPQPEFLNKLSAIREILTSNGRSIAQGALAWIWGRSGRTVPIPGFKSVKQVEENAGAMECGPLTTNQMSEIEDILGR